MQTDDTNRELVQTITAFCAIHPHQRDHHVSVTFAYMPATLLSVRNLSLHGVAANKIIGPMDHLGKGEGEVVIPIKCNYMIFINFNEDSVLLQMKQTGGLLQHLNW